VPTATDSPSDLVTAIIPAYDRPARTRRAIRSIVEQTYDPVELILVDDGSTPPLGERLDGEYAELWGYELLTHETNRGANAARNTGIEAASGEYLAFLDSDDEWAPEKMEEQIVRFQAVPDSVGAVYTGVRQVDENGETNAVKRPDTSGRITKRLLLRNFIGTFSCVMVRSSVFETVALLDERFPSWQDWEFYLRLSQHFEFEAVSDPLVTRHIEGDQIGDAYRHKREETLPLFRDTFEPLAREYSPLFRRKWRGYLCYNLALSALTNGEYAEGRRLLIRGLRWYPAIPRAYAHLMFSLAGGGLYESVRGIKRAIARSLD